MIGKDLKYIVSMIPDQAWVIIDRNWNVSIEDIQVEISDEAIANIRITEGYSITKDSVIEGWFESMADAAYRK